MLKYTTVSADASSKPTRTGLLTGQHRQSSANNSTKKLQRVFKRVNLKHGELGAGDPDCSMDDVVDPVTRWTYYRVVSEEEEQDIAG